MKHRAIIKGGKVIFDNPTAWTVDCAKLEGKQVELTIAQKRATRSANQNRYVWGIVVPMLCDAIGYPVQEAEECWSSIKIAVGHCKDTKLGKVALPTKNMSTAEFSCLVDAIRAFSSCELGIRIPSPNETDYGV
jgi:hypothetical protein